MKKGNCFEANYKALLDKPFGQLWFLCHGVVTGQAGDVKNIRYVHAWLEYDEMVFDYSNGAIVVLPRADYYRIGRIEMVIRYNAREAMVIALTKCTYGCWDELFDNYL